MKALARTRPDAPMRDAIASIREPACRPRRCLS